jgi:hypothetical protein
VKNIYIYIYYVVNDGERGGGINHGDEVSLREREKERNV